MLRSCITVSTDRKYKISPPDIIQYTASLYRAMCRIGKEKQVGVYEF